MSRTPRPWAPRSPAATMQAGKPLGFWSAIVQIVVADVSMSLDNVLAVAGAAKGHTGVLVIGLAIAVVLMAVAASFIAKLLVRFPWITWIGLAIVLYVARRHDVARIAGGGLRLCARRDLPAGSGGLHGGAGGVLDQLVRYAAPLSSAHHSPSLARGSDPQGLTPCPVANDLQLLVANDSEYGERQWMYPTSVLRVCGAWS